MLGSSDNNCKAVHMPSAVPVHRPACGPHLLLAASFGQSTECSACVLDENVCSTPSCGLVMKEELVMSHKARLACTPLAVPQV
jgi:hypothetical protein